MACTVGVSFIYVASLPFRMVSRIFPETQNLLADGCWIKEEKGEIREVERTEKGEC